MAGLFALAVGGDAGAQPISQLESRIGSAEADAGGLAARIDAGNAELAAAQERAEAAAAEEGRLASVLATGEEREAELAARVAESQARLEHARRRLERALGALADRLVAIYKGETINETQLLLDAEGYDDLATRALLLRRIQEADQRMAERVRELREAVAHKLAAFEDARAAQALHNAQVAEARDQMAAARAAAEEQAAGLLALQREQEAALAGLRSQIAGWSDQVRAARAAAAAQSSVQPTGGGPWAIPAGIVMCESGGNYGAVNPSSGAGGAYQILPSTWALYGGSGLPQNAPPGAQDRIAAQIWADSGGSAWVCSG